MKLKDALIGLISWLGLLMFMLVALSLESAPMWVVFILATLVWIIYVVVIMREKQALIWLEINGQWRAIDSTGNLVPPHKMPPIPIEHNAPHLYDQEEDRL